MAAALIDPSGAVPVVRSALRHLYRSQRITRRQLHSYTHQVAAASGEMRTLPLTRRQPIEAILSIMAQMAKGGTLTSSRLPDLFLTLKSNMRYWRRGPLLSFGDRVEFSGSLLVWEYYPGQGLQLQALGSFGKADWYCSAGKKYAPKCAQALAELIPLAVRRGGGLTWEYYFNFDGGAPPWTSAMSQGTAIQSLADASKELADPHYLTIAKRALPVLTARPPAGVGVRTTRGIRFVQYSFAPARSQEVINAFLQTVIGLGDYAITSKDPKATRLFRAGEAESKSELPSFNTGAWSLYQPGIEDDLSYHQLVTGFLKQLCAMTGVWRYCTTAGAFERDLKTPPVLRLLTTRVKRRAAAPVYFRLSKSSRVGITIKGAGTTKFLTSASFPYGRQHFLIPPLRRGRYTVTLDATDLAGNYIQHTYRLRAIR